MKVPVRGVDVELTNRCNALCSFCPRAETPQQGFMTFETFEKVVARVLELNEKSPHYIDFTGQGESTLHPQLLEFATYAKSKRLGVRMTTNANLLDKDKSRALIEAGLISVTFSVSDFGDDYELVYNLSFEKTRTNILDFLALTKEYPEREIDIVISIVKHDINMNKIEEMKRFWYGLGVKYVMEFDQNNRGGACDNQHYFSGNNTYELEANKILANGKISSLCAAPFRFIFVGWNGQYYICCSDYRKQSPLGSVFEYGIEEMEAIKFEALKGYIPACASCNIDPVNAVREVLFEMEHGISSQDKLDTTLKYLKSNNNEWLPQDIDILNWRETSPLRLKNIS
jgi:MoaA/NifB/PqqE/SkfB family radical SAM enzyme